MTEYATGYQPISSYCDEDNEDDDSVPQFQHTGDADPEAPPNETIHVVPDRSKARWNHIEDLDQFFTRVYLYHQRSGFLCMVLQDFLQLIQFLFVVIFSTFLIKCVDYEVLFYEKEYNHTHKVTIAESVLSVNQCFARFDAVMVICITIALFFWILRFMKVLYNVFKYYEIRCFYSEALKISNAELLNVTWHEVQLKLLEVQQEQQMCIHKQHLNQLDIYHRILRFKNYMVAMVNKDLLTLRFQVPVLGESVFLTSGLKYNLEMLLFWGPWAPFENNWHLKSEYRDHHKREQLAQRLSRHILWVGIANFLLCPVIFMWQILYSFYRYAEVLKREPGSLGSRRWSLYSRLYLRHFNELDHEFNARLCRAYKPAEKYMNIFTSPAVVILAKHIAFLAGSILAVLVILTMIDEDVLGVQHMLVTMTTAGVVVTICGACIPDEHMVFCPELLLRSVLGHIHYMPDHWRGQGHNHRTRNEFAQYFQYKVVYLLEEVMSPILTPLILTFSVRHKALDIIDFFRNFTVEITGVGDVCSFAQMDIRKHGNPKWTEDEKTEAGLHEQGENGKTELSLMHFTLTNPEWKPATPETDFLSQLKKQVHRDASALPMMPQDNPLTNSLSSINFGAPGGYSSMMTSFSAQNHLVTDRGVQELPDSGPYSLLTTDSPPAPMPTVRGALKNAEGPLSGSGNGLLTSIHSNPGVREDALEYLSAEMSFSALYMHELHHRKMRQPFFGEAAPSLWQQPSPTNTAGFTNPRMPNIQEDEVELENIPIRGIWQSGKSSINSDTSAMSAPQVLMTLERPPDDISHSSS